MLWSFQKKNTKKNVDILFVGKGVCFDSGGISIKPSGGMEDMKWDMAGSAVTASIMKYLSEIKTNFSYAGIVGLVENMPSGTAYKPGDIIKSYKGINVEVLNTDAEGRLILADGLSYASKHYDPEYILDFATLTGAVVVALGHIATGVMGTDDELRNKVKSASESTGEKVWEFPLWPEFCKQIKMNKMSIKGKIQQ